MNTTEIMTEDDQIIDILFCGIKEEPCELTTEWTSARGVKECDDVCELFGGPPTKWEKFKASFKFILFDVKVIFKQFFYKYIWYTRHRTEPIPWQNEYLKWYAISEVKLFGKWVLLSKKEMEWKYGNTEK